VQDQFTLTILRSCSDATLVSTGDLQDVIYYINTGNSASIQPLYTLTPAATDPTVACKPSFYLHFWNTRKKLWVEYNALTDLFATWDPTNGILIVNTNSYSLDTTEYLTRITSLVTGTNFSDEFTITIKD
jgi:hypothetical protein